MTFSFTGKTPAMCTTPHTPFATFGSNAESSTMSPAPAAKFGTTSCWSHASSPASQADRDSALSQKSPQEFAADSTSDSRKAVTLLEPRRHDTTLATFTRSMFVNPLDEKTRRGGLWSCGRQSESRGVTARKDSPELPKWLLPTTTTAVFTSPVGTRKFGAASVTCGGPAPRHGSSSRKESSSAAEEDRPALRFLDMAPELRNLVYRNLLVSSTGYLTLTIDIVHGGFKEGNREATNIDIGILAACQQVYSEAKNILYEENIFLMGGSIALSNMAVLRHAPFPDKALSRVTSLVLVCDHTEGRGHTKIFDYGKLIWRHFQDLTGLKRLRICEVERENFRGDDERKELMLEQIIERIPAGCELSYASQSSVEKKFVSDMMKRADEPRYKEYYHLQNAREVEEEVLRKCAKKSMHKKGVKSGDTTDYRFPARLDLGKLGTLATNDSIDPRFIFGGSL